MSPLDQGQGSEGQSEALRAGPQGHTLIWDQKLRRILIPNSAPPQLGNTKLQLPEAHHELNCSHLVTFLLLSQPEPSTQPSSDFLRIITAHQTGIMVTTTTIIMMSNCAYLPTVLRITKHFVEISSFAMKTHRNYVSSLVFLISFRKDKVTDI